MDRPLVIMPCLDMIAGRVVKGVRFVDIKDAGDPVECCRAYCAAGADELAMLDITATLESRATLLDVTRRVAEAVTVPFTMGGGISSVEAAEAVLNAGANKFSTSSAAFRNPTMLREMVREFGSTPWSGRSRPTASASGASCRLPSRRTASAPDTTCRSSARYARWRALRWTSSRPAALARSSTSPSTTCAGNLPPKD